MLFLQVQVFAKALLLLAVFKLKLFQEIKNDKKKKEKYIETFKKKLDEYLRTIPDVPGTSKNSLSLHIQQ